MQRTNVQAHLVQNFTGRVHSVPWALLLARGKLTLVPLVGQTATKSRETDIRMGNSGEKSTNVKLLHFRFFLHS